MVKINKIDYYIPSDKLKNSIKDRDIKIKELVKQLESEKRKTQALMAALNKSEDKYNEFKRGQIAWLEGLYKRYNYNEFRKQIDFILEFR